MDLPEKIKSHHWERVGTLHSIFECRQCRLMLLVTCPNSTYLPINTEQLWRDGVDGIIYSCIDPGPQAKHDSMCNISSCQERLLRIALKE